MTSAYYDPKERSSVYSGDNPLDMIRRTWLYACGITYDEIKKPFIAIANTYAEMHPGHVHLRSIVERVKAGILSAGGVPFEFGTIALCDGLMQAHEGNNYALPSREIIADSIEVAVRGHRYDGVVLVGSCDKIIPALLMVAARLDLPAIVVAGGSAPPGYWAREKVHMSTEFEGKGAVKILGLEPQQREEALSSLYPCAGACWAMGTANTMACLTEALGMSLPGDGSAPAVSAQKLRLAEMAGAKIMDLVKRGTTPGKIITMASLKNALKVNMAIGGSLNTVLHLPAIAHELGLKLDLSDFDATSREIPFLANVEPNGPYSVVDFHHAGGIPAVLKRLESKIDGSVITVTGKTMAENIINFEVFDDEIIRPLANPVHPYGGIAVLKGNLAENGAVIKQVGLPQELWRFSGPAKVYNSEEEAIKAINANMIKAGDVVIVRYEGPKGGPGMREMAFFRVLQKMMGLDYSCYTITDGRFSGYSEGACVGYLSPEAFAGGVIALVQDGDIIEIDVDKRLLQLKVTNAELAERRKRLVHPQNKVARGYLEVYRALVGPADQGAVLKRNIPLFPLSDQPA
jgi:dihydroxy-acid dehydratase